MSEAFAISASDVRRAARRLKGRAVYTPLLESQALNERAGGRVLIKFEGAQHTGSFKFRGAYHRLSHIADAQRTAGVVAFSSGNHAQGVAAAARALGMPAVIVMPSDAPAIKLANTRRLGAEVVIYDRFSDSREAIAGDLATRRRATLVPSFDDPLIMAGQGTIGLEILQQAPPDAGIRRVLVPCGGGGLVAGVATAIKDVRQEIAIYAVEPAAFDDTARSLASGRRETIGRDARSLCDALLTPTPGELTFPINRALLSGALTVTDDEVKTAMRVAFDTLKIVCEPGGSVGLAALLHGRVPADGTSVVVISGANVDRALFAAIIMEDVDRPDVGVLAPV